MFLSIFLYFDFCDLNIYGRREAQDSGGEGMDT